MRRPEFGNFFFRDTGGIGWADIVPTGAASIVGRHHSVVSLRLVVTDADHAIPLRGAQGAHVLLADFHLEVSGAHVVREIWQHRGRFFSAFRYAA